MKIFHETRRDFMESAPKWLIINLERAKKWKIASWSTDSRGEWEPLLDGTGVEDQRGSPREEVHLLEGAQAISSELNNGLHMVAIDIDVPAVLIPSTTRGHSHLYIAVENKWPVYRALLDALTEAGVIERGYLGASVERRATYLRLPWIRKGSEASDLQRSLGEWLDEPAAPVPVPPL